MPAETSTSETGFEIPTSEGLDQETSGVVEESAEQKGAEEEQKPEEPEADTEAVTEESKDKQEGKTAETGQGVEGESSEAGEEKAAALEEQKSREAVETQGRIAQVEQNLKAAVQEAVQSQRQPEELPREVLPTEQDEAMGLVGVLNKLRRAFKIAVRFLFRLWMASEGRQLPAEVGPSGQQVKRDTGQGETKPPESSPASPPQQSPPELVEKPGSV